MINFRLRTTEETAKKLKELERNTGIKPNVLSKISLALSLNIKEQPKPVQSEPNGLEFNRHTLTGELDIVYKSLIKQHLGKNISEENYFPDLFNAHLTRGVNKLYQEYQLAGNSQKLTMNLLNIAKMNMEEVK